MKESLPSKLESIKPVDYKTFKIYQLIINDIDHHLIPEANELMIGFMAHPNMMGAHEVEILEELIFDHEGDKNSQMFIDVYKKAVDNFFLEAGKRNLLVKYKGNEGFGTLGSN